LDHRSLQTNRTALAHVSQRLGLTMGLAIPKLLNLPGRHGAWRMANCLIRMLTNLAHKHRSVAVIEDHSSPLANLKGFFPKMPVTSDDRYYRKSFDYWLGDFRNNRRFHGWDKSQYNGKFTECFVFKNVSEAERVYGFLCRPKRNDTNYEMCVLVHSATKKKWTTDTAELQRAKDMKSDADVLKALQDPNLFIKGKGRCK
jgi:hypothetical protein